MSQRVAVLMGGWSSEREVSLVSGRDCAAALEAQGYSVRRIDVTRDLDALLAALTPRPDVAFNALLGTGGEDGTIHGVLEFLRIPYTHSGLLASAVAMHKPTAKAVFAAAGPAARRRPGGLAQRAPARRYLSAALRREAHRRRLERRRAHRPLQRQFVG